MASERFMKETAAAEAGARLYQRAGALRTSILAGIIYDWAVAALILASPAPVLALLRIPPPPVPFHFQFAALPLVILPFFYRLAWRDPVRNSGIVGAMVIARLAGFAYLALYGGVRGEPAAFLAFGVVDLAFALAHLALARRAGFSRRELFSLA